MATSLEESVLRTLVLDGVRAESTTRYDGDAFWILFSGFLVFFMHAGFAMLEAGSVRDKNKVNILFKNIATVTFGGVAYFLVGYGLAYGAAENNSFIGGTFYATEGFSQSFLEGTNDRRDFFFQYAFCVTAATITSGAVAGRIKLEAYFILAIALTGVIYPVVTNWVWSGTGWLSAFKGSAPDDLELYIFSEDYDHACGVLDYAGSGVVHLTGGVSAFWAALILGPRYGRFDGKSVIPMPGHNLSMATLGTFILWFGWFGFNCGSALAFDGINVSKVAVTTALAPASACVFSIVVQRFRTGKYDLPGALNAILAGLVSITAGCSTVSDFAAIPIGVIGASIYIISSETLLKFRIDDPIGASPVHGFCGIWGVLSIGIFSTPEFVGVAYSCPNAPEPSPSGDWLDVLSGYQLLQQLILVLAVIAWVTATVLPLMFGMRFFGILRIPDDEQAAGLDVSEHGVMNEYEDQYEEEVVKDEEPKDADVDEAVEVKGEMVSDTDVVVSPSGAPPRIAPSI